MTVHLPVPALQDCLEKDMSLAQWLMAHFFLEYNDTQIISILSAANLATIMSVIKLSFTSPRTFIAALPLSRSPYDELLAWIYMYMRHSLRTGPTKSVLYTSFFFGAIADREVLHLIHKHFWGTSHPLFLSL